MGQRPYTKQINLCLSLLREQKKKTHFASLNEKDISDNRKFWHTIKPFLSDKMRSRESLILVEKDKAII